MWKLAEYQRPQLSSSGRQHSAATQISIPGLGVPVHKAGDPLLHKALQRRLQQPTYGGLLRVRIDSSVHERRLPGVQRQVHW